MNIVTFYNGQNVEEFVNFLQKQKDWPIILSQVKLNLPNLYLILPNNIPHIDDKYRAWLNFLQRLETEEEVTFLNWEEIIYSGQSVEYYEAKLKNTNIGVHFVQEPVKIQDFRLPPYMENLLMISNSLNLDTDRLFNDNPYLLTDRLFKGPRKNVIAACSMITGKRAELGSSSLTASLPILNSLFYTCEPT